MNQTENTTKSLVKHRLVSIEKATSSIYGIGRARGGIAFELREGFSTCFVLDQPKYNRKTLQGFFNLITSRINVEIGRDCKTLQN